MNNIYEPEFVKKLFNQMSNSYERMNYITSFGFSIRWRKQFLKKLGVSNDQLYVIDLLSGLGENWSYLKKSFPNSKFYAIDFSENMIHYSRSKGNRIFHGDLNLICDDMLHNNLPSNTFDIVCSAYGLKTFNKRQLYILAKEVSRILKSNGKFSFVEVSKPKNKLLYCLYGFYLGKVIPLLGKLFLGNSDDYSMLWIYTSQFGNAKEVQEIFKKHGLEVRLDEYFAGCASCITGKKL